jgi:hypothetical protein
MPPDEEDEEMSNKKHLCDTCQEKYDYPRCRGEQFTFGIDVDPSARGAEADKIVECDAYRKIPPSPPGTGIVSRKCDRRECEHG